MKTIIAGSRSFTSYEELAAVIDKLVEWTPTQVISGAARGVDTLGERWAKEHNVPLLRMPAEWKLHGRAAGFIRNADMAEKAEALIAIWDSTSRGTADMIQRARLLKLKVFIHIFQPSQ